MHTHRQLNQQGVSLLAVLIGMSLGFLIITGVSQLFSKSMKSSNSISRVRRLENIRRVIRLKMDCEQTMDATSNGTNLSSYLLYDRNGRTILHDNGNAMVMGGWQIKAMPVAGRPGLFRVEASNSSYTNQDLFARSAPIFCP